MKHNNNSLAAPSSKKTDIFMLKRLSSYIGPHLHLLIIATIFLVMATLLQLLRPLIVKEVIDVGIPAKDMPFILQQSLYYGAIVLGGMIALFIENYTLQVFGQRIIYEIRNEVAKVLMALPVKEFSKTPIGNLVTRVTNDTESLRTLYTEVVLKLGSSILQVVGILAFMYYLDVELAFVVTCLLPVFVGTILLYRQFARKAYRGVRTKLAASNTSVQEMLNFIVVIKSYVGEKLIEKQYDKVSQEFLGAGLYEVKTFAIFRPIVDALFFVAIITIFGYANWFGDGIAAGTVFAFYQYITRIFEPIKEIADKYNSLQSALAGAERLIPVLEQVDIYTIKPVIVPEELRNVETITFDHVWFSYDNNETYALEDIHFQIKKGEFIGIAGPSGGGKSTLVSLLMGFQTPTKGKILINGFDIENYSPAILREVIGFVFQDSHLFKGTIKENLTLYDEMIESHSVEQATKKAHLYEAIKNLEQGYDTPVGYLGSWLSQGQKQLLAMARALVKDKPVLIFDEATAHIDSHTEQLIQDSIETIRGEKTIISIAHRLSTIRHASQIFMIEKGRIVENGSFDQLMDKKGAFYSLWTL